MFAPGLAAELSYAMRLLGSIQRSTSGSSGLYIVLCANFEALNIQLNPFSNDSQDSVVQVVGNVEIVGIVLGVKVYKYGFQRSGYNPRKIGKFRQRNIINIVAVRKLRLSGVSGVVLSTHGIPPCVFACRSRLLAVA